MGFIFLSVVIILLKDLIDARLDEEGRRGERGDGADIPEHLADEALVSFDEIEHVEH